MEICPQPEKSMKMSIKYFIYLYTDTRVRHSYISPIYTYIFFLVHLKNPKNSVILFDIIDYTIVSIVK